MPWMIVDEGVDQVDERYCVYKHDPDHKPVGKALGCHPSRAEAEKQIAALEINVHDGKAMGMRLGPDSAVKAATDGDGWTLDVLGVPFGGPDNKDADGEWFTPETDVMLEIGDKRPALYYHGRAPNGRPLDKPEIVGTAEYIGKRPDGHWFRVALDRARRYSKRIREAALAGIARASSGAIAHLFRRAESGEIGVWPVGELSLIDIGMGRAPANWDAVAMPMKAVFNDAGLEMPKSFIEGEEPKMNEVPGESASEQIVSEEDKAPYFAAAAAGAAVAYKGH